MTYYLKTLKENLSNHLSFPKKNLKKNKIVPVVEKLELSHQCEHRYWIYQPSATRSFNLIKQFNNSKIINYFEVNVYILIAK